MIQVTQLSILYAEDEPDARQLIATMVKMKYPGVTMYLARDGQEGLDLFLQHRPDLLMTDLNLPVLDGIGLAKKVKSIAPETYIIAITASNETKYMLDSIEIGINSYVLKPVEYNHLWRGIDRCIEEKALKQQVYEQDKHIRTLSRAVEESPCAIIISDAEGIIEYANTCFTRLTGFQPEEVRGKGLRLLESQGMSSEGTGPWLSVSTGQEWRGEYLSQAKDGDYFWASSSSSPIYDTAGNLLHFVTIIEEITATKQKESQLQQSNERVKDLYRSIPVLLISIDRGGRIVEANDQWLDALGYCREEVLGRKYSDFLTASSPLFSNEIAIPEFFQDCAGVSIPYQLMKKNGEAVDFLVSTKVRRNYLGDLVQSIVALTDIRGQSTKLWEKESRYKHFFEHARDGFILCADDGRIVDANSEACRMLGRSREELLCSNGSLLFCSEEPELWEGKMKSGSFRETLNATRKDGSVLPVDFTATHYRDRHGRTFSTIVITDLAWRQQEPFAPEGDNSNVQYLR